MGGVCDERVSSTRKVSDVVWRRAAYAYTVGTPATVRERGKDEKAYIADEAHKQDDRDDGGRARRVCDFPYTAYGVERVFCVLHQVELRFHDDGEFLRGALCADNQHSRHVLCLYGGVCVPARARGDSGHTHQSGRAGGQERERRGDGNRAAYVRGAGDRRHNSRGGVFVTFSQRTRQGALRKGDLRIT